MIKRKGFTLIELLVVIGIIALLSTLAVVALNNARLKARDAKRVADIKQVQTALELYYQDQNGYPVSTVTIGVATSSGACLGDQGWGTAQGAAANQCGATLYMGQGPSNPGPNGIPYQYSSSAAASYQILFNLEGATGQLGAGTRTADGNGMR